MNRCVDSVLSQTYSDLEIILVDDGSDDSSGNLCDKYMEADPRVLVIHGCNQGAAFARNQGIEIAKGEYITFIDSDDYVTPDYIEKLVEAFEKNDCVLAICNSYNSENGKLTKRKLPVERRCLVKDFVKDTFYNRIEGGSCWGKLTDVLRSCEEIRNTCHDNYPEFMNSSDALLINNAFFVYLNLKKNTEPEGNALRTETLSIIRKYRKSVLHDREASLKTKGACLLSYVSLGLLSFVYDLL